MTALRSVLMLPKMMKMMAKVIMLMMMMMMMISVLGSCKAMAWKRINQAHTHTQIKPTVQTSCCVHSFARESWGILCLPLPPLLASLPTPPVFYLC